MNPQKQWIYYSPELNVLIIRHLELIDYETNKSPVEWDWKDLLEIQEKYGSGEPVGKFYWEYIGEL